ncbi:MAG: PadR family transcriptional regulator [Nitrososphaerota archaeon]|nr:PadR family transcriptional regulator [Nitrososphaerota archaeon]
MPERPERTDSKSLTHPQGAPRGLLLHYMLRKIAQSPCHGYEILQDIDSKTEGAWRPGAGSIYPILKKLVANGYIKANEGTKSADRKVYSITPKGLDSIKEDEKLFLNSGRNWMAMRRLFVELIQPEHLTRFMSEGTKGQFELTQEIITSKMDVIPQKDREYILKEYILNLERQLEWANRALKERRPVPEAKGRK